MRTLLILTLALLPIRASAKCSKRGTLASFMAAGKFGVGVKTLTLVDASRTTQGRPSRTLTTEVWYPTAKKPDEPTRDAPLARGGPFPLVVNSPGLLDSREGETYYGTALAARGYVVASIDFPLTNGSANPPDLTDLHNQPGDVRFVIDELEKLSHMHGAWLAGGVSRRRIGVTGVSLGAVTTLLVTYHPTFRDPRVRAALPIAPGGGCAVNEKFFATDRPRLLVVVGEQDLILPPDVNARPAIDLVHSARELVTLVAGTHTAFVINFPSNMSYDKLGCSALTHIAQWGNPFDGLGGPDAGFSASDTSCQHICTTPPPSNRPMQSQRQQDLTRAIEVAFFESTMRHSRAGRCFVETGLAQEPDVR